MAQSLWRADDGPAEDASGEAAEPLCDEGPAEEADDGPAEGRPAEGPDDEPAVEAAGRAAEPLCDEGQAEEAAEQAAEPILAPDTSRPKASTEQQAPRASRGSISDFGGGEQH